MQKDKKRKKLNRKKMSPPFLLLSHVSLTLRCVAFHSPMTGQDGFPKPPRDVPCLVRNEGCMCVCMCMCM